MESNVDAVKMLANRGPMKLEQIKVEIPLPNNGTLIGILTPHQTERDAAWEFYVELVTRITVVELRPSEGLLREALTSLYSLFETTRKVLRHYGPSIATVSEAVKDPEAMPTSIGRLAVEILNLGVRPLLAKWHPLLSDYEATRAAGVSAYAHEQAWSRSGELRTALSDLREGLHAYAKILEQVAGVTSSLIVEQGAR